MSTRARLAFRLAMFSTAALVCLVAAAPTLAADPKTKRVSVDSAEAQSDSGGDRPSVSSSGRYVAFQSYSSDLVADDTNGTRDVFVRDRRAGTTERVSISSAENEATGDSNNPSISADGRYVTFQSDASDLVVNDTNGDDDIFVRDRQRGTTKRVSISSVEGQANGNSQHPAVSADGRYIAFYSYATDLVANDTNGQSDIFVRDRRQGTTRRVSIDSSEGQANGQSFYPSISADGRYIAFDSFADDLVASDTNSATDVFVRDRQQGTTRRISISSGEGEGNGGSFDPSISADGRVVAFESVATNLIGSDTNKARDIFVRDRQLGTTRRVSIDSSEVPANSASSTPSISADGRHVAFDSIADNLVANDTNAVSDVFLRDRQQGTTRRVSIATTESQGDGGSFYPSISPEGRYVAFQSDASDLVANDTNGVTDVFMRGPLR